MKTAKKGNLENKLKIRKNLEKIKFRRNEILQKNENLKKLTNCKKGKNFKEN